MNLRNRYFIGGIIGFILALLAIVSPPMDSRSLLGTILLFAYKVFFGEIYERWDFGKMLVISFWNYGYIVFATILGVIYGVIFNEIYKISRKAIYGSFIGAIVSVGILRISFWIELLGVIWYWIFGGFLLDKGEGVIINTELYYVLIIVGAFYGILIGLLVDLIYKNKVK